MWKSLVLALSLGVSLAAVAHAQAAGPSGNPCQADVKQLCADVKPGRGTVLRCLHEHQSSVSATCKEFLQERAARHRAEAKACKGDVETLCKGVEPRGGRIIACLRQHEAELSPGCKAEIPKT